MSFEEVDDNLWERVVLFLPDPKPKTGRPRADLRKTFNGILYVLHTGCRWSEVPKTYGSKSTIHRLHLKMSKEGIYKKIFEILLSEGYEINKIDLSATFVDTKDIPAKKGV